MWFEQKLVDGGSKIRWLKTTTATATATTTTTATTTATTTTTTKKKKSPQQVSEEHHIVHDLWLCFVVVLWHSSLETKGLQLGICWCPWWNFDHWRCRRNCTGWTTIPRSLLKGIHPKNTHYIWCVWGWLLRGLHLKGKLFPPFPYEWTAELRTKTMHQHW